MSVEWSEVPLGKVLKVANDYVQIDPDETYKISGIYGWGRGMLTRESLQGKNTSYKRFVRLHEDDLALSHLKAWEGAIARIPATYDGWFLSTQFSTFRPVPELLDIGYLEWFCKLPKLWETLEKGARGMGARRSTVSAEQFLSVPITLPPLSEQRRVVRRLERLASKIEEARGLREQSLKATSVLWKTIGRAILDQMKDVKKVPLRDLVSMSGGGTPSKNNPMFWNGDVPWITPKDMKKRELDGSTDYITRAAIKNSSAKLIEPGAVLIVVRGMILAHTVPAAITKVSVTVNQDMKALRPKANLDSSFLLTFLWAMNDALLGLVESSTHGTRKLQTAPLLNFKIPVPPLSEQKRLVENLNAFQTKVNSLKQFQGLTRGELNALLPSVLDKAFRGEF